MPVLAAGSEGVGVDACACACERVPWWGRGAADVRGSLITCSFPHWQGEHKMQVDDFVAISDVNEAQSPAIIHTNCD